MIFLKNAIHYFLAFLLVTLSFGCSDDEITPLNEESNPETQEILDNEESDIKFETEDVSFNLINLKWEAVTAPNNEQVFYDIFLGNTKIVDSNEDTDYTITGLEANTAYTGKIVPKIVDASPEVSPKKIRSIKQLIELNPINFSVRTLQFSNPDAPKPELNPVTVDAITKESAMVKWEAATVTDNSTVSYNVYLNGDVKASNLQSTEFTFSGLKEKTSYSGVVLAISENQKSTLQNFEFTTLADPDEIPTTSVTFFRGTSTTFANNDFFQLIPIVAPANATAVTFNWESSNPNIASVDESGYVNTRDLGTTTITASFADDPAIFASINITVEAPTTSVNDPSISIQPKRASLLVGDTFKYQVNRFNFQVGDAVDASLEFTTSDPNIATIDNEGNIVAVQNGTVAVSVTSSIDANISYVAMLRVVTTPISVTSIKTFKVGTDFELFRGGTDNVGFVPLPEDATNGTLLYSSTSESVIEVTDSGFVRAIGVGQASVIITSFSNNEISETLNYTVLEDPVTFDEDTKLYTAPAESEIQLELFGNVSLPLETTSEKFALAQVEFIVNNSNGDSLLDDADSLRTIQIDILDENEFEFFGQAFFVINFVMPADGQVTIDAKVTVLGPDDIIVNFFDVTILPQQGLRKSFAVFGDNLIVNP